MMFYIIYILLPYISTSIFSVSQASYNYSLPYASFDYSNNWFYVQSKNLNFSNSLPLAYIYSTTNSTINNFTTNYQYKDLEISSTGVSLDGS